MGRDVPIWKARSARGDPFESPEALWDAAVAYFDWVEANPLYEHKPFAYQGEVRIERIAKMRAMSITGLTMFLGCSKEQWAEYLLSETYSEVATRVEDVIKTQKLEGAAADLLNASIVQRELGTRDTAEQRTPEMLSDEDLDARIAELLAEAGIDRVLAGEAAEAEEKPPRSLSPVRKAKGVPRRRRAAR